MNAWAAAIGVLALVAWMIAAPPWREGRRGWLRSAAAMILLLGLLDVSCRLPGGSRAPRLRVLIDRSESMRLAGPTGPSRGEAGRAWLEGPAFRRWSERWTVEIDSFGGPDSDPGGAVDRAGEELPDAILVVTDGRVSGGRSIGPTDVPVFALLPEPLAFSDAAVLDLRLSGGEDELAVVEAAAVGGLPTPGGRIELTVEGRSLGGRDLPPLEAGERRLIRFPMPPGGDDYATVTARVSVPGDPVPDNDERNLIREPPGPSRALVVALGPTWDFAPWQRALERSHPGAVDAYWSFPGGGLRPLDGGRSVAWTSLSTARYGVVYLLGPPAALGSTGRAWVERLVGSGGRGILWAPAGGEGDLVGAGTRVEGSRSDAIPALTEEGRSWLSRLGATPSAAPDGGPGWPVLEDLPAVARPPSRATLLLATGESPVAWVAEEGTTRRAVTLGTGYYRWPIAGGPADDHAAAFWRSWSDALARWLASASPAIRPLVRLPAGRAVPASEPLRVPVAEDAGALRWRVERGEEELASGELSAADRARAIVVDPLPPGAYRLSVEAEAGRTASEPFVVERWSPELAWTTADTAGLSAAARRSGGARLSPGGSPEPLAARPVDLLGEVDARRLDLGTWPWTYLFAAILVLADWALARPAPR